MDAKSVMKKLKSLGTAQNRKIYSRHGAGDNQFGVSFANLNKISSTIKKNNQIAAELWDTRNTDAMILSTMIMDDSYITLKNAKAMVKDIHYYVLADSFATCATGSDDWFGIIKFLLKSRLEYELQVGFSMIATALKNNRGLDDKFCLDLLEKIKNEITGAPNRARYSMNYALIAMGVYKDKIRKRVLDVADEIGKIEIDHGRTSCKTPDARKYIEKTVARLKTK